MVEFQLPCDQCCAVTLLAAVALRCVYEAGGLVVLVVEDAGLGIWSFVGLFWLYNCSVLCYHLSPSGRHVRLAS